MAVSRILKILANLLVNTGLVIGSTLLGFYLAIYLYIHWAANHQKPLVRVVRNNSLIQAIYMKSNTVLLFNLVREKTREGGYIATTWDYNSGVNLSKTLFMETTMYGQKKYRYLPNITVYNGRIWDGFGYINLATRVTPEIRGLILQSKTEYSAFFNTNEYGFKETQPASASNALRVFFLGDSFTEGLWVKPEDTFASLFGKLFQDQGIPVTPYNLGVNGYSPLEESWMLEHFGDTLKPRLVILNLFPNDVDPNTWGVITGAVPPGQYQEMFLYMNRIRDYTRAHHMELVVTVIPPLWRPTPQQFSPQFWDQVQHWCQQNHIRYLDPRPVLYTDEINKYYIYFDPHLTPEGHRVYATFLYQQLQPLIHNLAGRTAASR